MANRSHSVKTSLDLVGRRGREEEEKTKQNREVISLASAENLPPVPHLLLGCTLLKLYSLQEVQMLSRSAWQQKCLERDLNCFFLLRGTAIQLELTMPTGLESGRRRKTLPLLFVSAEENQVGTCHLHMPFIISQISKTLISRENCRKTLLFFHCDLVK